MPAQSLQPRGVAVLAALVASIISLVVFAPAVLAQSGEDQYGCGIGGCEGEPGNPSGGSGGSGGGASLGPDGQAAGPGSGIGGFGAGSGGGFGAGSGGGLGGGSGGSAGGGAGVGPGGSFFGPIGSLAAGSALASKKLKEEGGRSLGEVLGGTDKVATATPAAATQNAGQGGGALLWLLLALGAVTAVAAGGVAVRRRHARQGF